jgi:hypothetical protein
LPGLVRRMAAWINSEPSPQAAKLWTATYLLMGLRYTDEVVDRLLEGVQNMTELTTYQAILRKGRMEGRDEGQTAEARRFLLLLGTERFGEPNATTMASLEAIQNLDRLEALGKRILSSDFQDWDGLLGAP